MACILVFPAGLSEAGAYASQARQNGKVVIGASSIPRDPARGADETDLFLPYIHHAEFEEALKRAIVDHEITEIYSSHEVVRHRLSVLLPLLAPDVTLVERLPLEKPADVPHDWYGLLSTSFGVGLSRLLSPVELTAVLTRAMAMRGESSVGKLVTLLALGGLLPRGDVVEIGALSGRSAFVLGWMARRFAIGPVLVLDPWSQEVALQHDAPEMLRDTTRSLDFEVFFQEFLENLTPCFFETLNYKRSIAHDVRQYYRREFAIDATEFGGTTYHGTIALLHVDGNHDQEAVTRDLQDWVPLIEPGGWVVLDDYVWSFGEGPRRAGDALLETLAIDCAFVCDGALFVRVPRKGTSPDA